MEWLFAICYASGIVAEDQHKTLDPTFHLFTRSSVLREGQSKPT